MIFCDKCEDEFTESHFYFYPGRSPRCKVKTQTYSREYERKQRGGMKKKSKFTYEPEPLPMQTENDIHISLFPHGQIIL